MEDSTALKSKLKRRYGGKFRLSDIFVSEVSLVDHGANMKPFFLYKRLNDESLDLNDPETMAKLEEEYESMDEGEKQEVETEVVAMLERFGEILDAKLMEQDYGRLRKNNPGLARRIKNFPGDIDWDWQKGFSLKPECEFKLTKKFNQAKTHYFDSETLRWVPVKRG